MNYTIYKTINKLNDKFYIGKHQTTNPDDDYLGSGKGIKAAIKKYGRENFTKEVLYIFESESEMNLKEKEILTEEFVFSNSNYNEGVGGEGGPHFKGKKHSEKTKAQIKQKLTGTKLSDEAKLKISESNKNRIVTDESKKKMSNAAKSRTQHLQSIETRLRISESLKTNMTEDRRLKLKESALRREANKRSAKLA